MRASFSRLASVIATSTTLVLSGCSFEPTPPGVAPEPSGSTSDPSPGSMSSTPRGLPKGVMGATDVPQDVANDPDLRDDVTVASCRRTPNGWRATGTARNPGQAPIDYAITVFFTTESATVIGTGTTRVAVGPGRKEAWRVEDAFEAPASTLCALRGVG